MAQHGKRYQKSRNSLTGTRSIRWMRRSNCSKRQRRRTSIRRSRCIFASALTPDTRISRCAPPRRCRQVRARRSRILVFAQGDGERVAREAGADYAGSDDLIQQDRGRLARFRCRLATPDMMGKVGRLGRVLGRRGLMPNPRSGTIAPPEDLPRVINERRGGRVDFRNDRTNLIHIPDREGELSRRSRSARIFSPQSMP